MASFIPMKLNTNILFSPKFQLPASISSSKLADPFFYPTSLLVCLVDISTFTCLKLHLWCPSPHFSVCTFSCLHDWLLHLYRWCISKSPWLFLQNVSSLAASSTFTTIILIPTTIIAHFSSWNHLLDGVLASTLPPRVWSQHETEKQVICCHSLAQSPPVALTTLQSKSQSLHSKSTDVYYSSYRCFKP